MDAAGDFEAYLKKFFKDDEDDAAAAVVALLQKEQEEPEELESIAEPEPELNEWNLDKELHRFVADLQAKHQKELQLVEEMTKNPDHEARAALFS